MTTSDGVTNLFGLKPKDCRVRLNKAGGKSHIMLHFNRLPPYHPDHGAVQPNKTKAEVHELCFAQESAEEEKNGAGVGVNYLEMAAQ
jgi:hypothetical protein